VRHPAHADAEELAAVVTRLTLPGSCISWDPRHPGVADELTEVAARHDRTSPATTRHLYAALGQHSVRQAKYLEVRFKAPLAGWCRRRRRQ
jgi:hypothetical protein